MLPQNKELKKFAQTLRNNATKQENRLWYEFLRNHPLQFNRQKVIMSYIADFYCAKARLVIELDGSQHYSDDGKARDAARDEAISALGLKVLRISNLDVDSNLRAVCDEINRVVAERTQETNHPAL